jgi:hypothetical protein
MMNDLRKKRWYFPVQLTITAARMKMKNDLGIATDISYIKNRKEIQSLLEVKRSKNERLKTLLTSYHIIYVLFWKYCDDA